MMKKKDKYEVVLEGGINMTYDQFIRKIQHGHEFEIKTKDYKIAIFNIGQNDEELFPEETLFIYQTKFLNKHIKDVYVKKQDLESFIICNNMTIKELWDNNLLVISKCFS